MRKSFRIAYIINFATIAITILVLNRLPPLIPLFYGRAVGQGQIAKSYELLIPPIIALIISFTNYLISKKFVDNNFLKDVLTYSSIFISILSAITVFRIILLVGFF